MSKSYGDPRQRLLDAGLRIFADRGYAGTSVLEVANEARVTKPTLYYYFASKEGLFQELIEQSMDERLRLMREAAPPGKETIEQLTDIILAMTDFARRRPELLRLGFALAFAAPGEVPASFHRHGKMRDSYLFLRVIIETGLERDVLDRSFTVDELTQSFLYLIHQSVVMTIIAAKRGPGETPLPPQMEPRRKVELFLRGAAGQAKPHPARLAKIALLTLALGFSSHGSAQTTNAAIAQAIPSPAISTNAASATVAKTPDASSHNPANTAPPEAPISPLVTNAVPLTAEVRPVPLAVSASHPELATVSPIAANAHDSHALDLQTCFQMTAVRDDSLKISMHDIEIARAQLSQSIAALWPTFNATNQQEFIHYGNPTSGFSISSLGLPGGTSGGSSGLVLPTTTSSNRNYESQSHITMNYTIFNGGQNYNNVGASAAVVAARRQTLARDYQTIYQDVAQAFYNVLQYEGDLVIQHDLIEALSARVDDLKGRVSLGRSRPSEFLQAQTDLANAHVTEEQQKGSLNAALETVAFYVGLPAKYLKLKEAQSFPSVAQLETYLQRSGARPDVLSQLESLRQAERNVAVAEGQVFPTVTATGDYLASQDPVSNEVDATMTLQISMPIFDGGLILAQIHENKELVRQSALNVEQLRRTADQDTRTAYVNFNASVAQVIVLREAVTLAAKNLEAQVDDYRKGVVSNLDVLTALQDYQNARQQLHNANMQTRLNLINLHVAAGLAATGPNANNQALPATTGGTLH